MKIIRFKFTIPILAGIYFLISLLAHNDIIKNGGYYQAELSVFFSVIPFVFSIFLLFIYYISYYLLDSLKIQITATTFSLLVFVPLLLFIFSIFIF